VDITGIRFVLVFALSWRNSRWKLGRRPLLDVCGFATPAVVVRPHRHWVDETGDQYCAVSRGTTQAASGSCLRADGDVDAVPNVGIASNVV